MRNGDRSILCVLLQADRIKKLLDNTATGTNSHAAAMEKTEGMKYLLAVRRERGKGPDGFSAHSEPGRLRDSELSGRTYDVTGWYQFLFVCWVRFALLNRLLFADWQQMARGGDVTPFFADVVRNVVVSIIKSK